MGTEADSTTILPAIPPTVTPNGRMASVITNPRIREAIATARRAARKAALPANPYLRALAVRFRLPMAGDPAPAERRLVVLCAWAALLGLGGAVMILRMIVDMFVPTTGWYGVLVMALGIIGLPATIGAFASIHRERLPWLLLGVGTVTLLAAYTAV